MDCLDQDGRMIAENPFDQLGLKKKLMLYLHKEGRLDDFLKGYKRLTHTSIHPDLGGSHDLAAMVNGAYAAIKEHPEQIPAWIQGMHNGASPEHLSLIEDLAVEVERLQKIEKDYGLLREQYAALLVAQQAGEEQKVKTAPASSSARSAGGGDPGVRTPPRVDYEEPKRGRAESSKKAEPIILSDIILYDARGKPARTYKKVTLDAGAIREGSSYAVKTQDGWITFFKKMGGEMPSLPLFYAIIERLQNEKNPIAGDILKDCKENWICTSTRFDYTKNSITHGYGFASAETFMVPLPIGGSVVKNVLTKDEWRTFLQAALMPKDLDKAIALLDTWSGVPSYVWTASSESRHTHPARAAFLYANSDWLLLHCSDALGNTGCSRWVALG